MYNDADILKIIKNRISTSLNMLGLYDDNSLSTSYIIYAKTNKELTKNSVFAIVDYNLKGYEYNSITNSYIEFFINSNIVDSANMYSLPQFNGLTLYDIEDIHKLNQKLTILSTTTFSNDNTGAIVQTDSYILAAYINHKKKISNILAIDYRYINSKLLTIYVNMLAAYHSKQIRC